MLYLENFFILRSQLLKAAKKTIVDGDLWTLEEEDKSGKVTECLEREWKIVVNKFVIFRIILYFFIFRNKHEIIRLTTILSNHFSYFRKIKEREAAQKARRNKQNKFSQDGIELEKLVSIKYSSTQLDIFQFV